MVPEELSVSNHAIYVTIAVQINKRGNSSAIEKSPKKRFLNTEIEDATADVKNRACWMLKKP